MYNPQLYNEVSILSFYTSVHRMGQNILFRGYTSEGHRIHRKVPFKPTMFVPSQKGESDWVALDGTKVEPVTFANIPEAEEFKANYSDVSNFKVYGNHNYVAQFIAEEYPDNINFDSKLIDVGNIDIEVASDDGFPHPDTANYPVISIAYKSSRENVYYVWGLGDYDPTIAEIDTRGALTKYYKCEDEKQLLQRFVGWWSEHTPDIITGWNIRLFDIPYLINRTEKVCGTKTTKHYSPWGIYKHRQIAIKGKSLDAYEIYGVSQVDYYDLFQKFGYSFGTQESYSLDHISHVVLGESKLSYEEHGNLFKLLTSKSRNITVDAAKPKENMANFEKWCLLRDRIKSKIS